MSILVTLAWRSLWTHKLRTVLTIVSIVLGVAVILAVRTANRSTINSVEALLNEAAGKASLTVESAVSSRQAQIGFPQDVVQHIQAMPGVVQAVPRLVAQTVYLQGKKGQVELAVQGVDPAVDDQVRAYSLVEGDFLSATDRGYTVVLVDDFAQREGIRVGQDIELLAPNGPEVFRVVGIMARKNAGLMNGGQVVFVPLQVGQDILRRGRKIDAVDVVAEPAIVQSPASLQRLRGQIQAVLGDAYTVGYPAAKGLQVTEALASVQYGLGFFGLFALFVSALLIYTTFTMELAERIREIGSLRTLGLSRTQIVGQLFGNALLLGLIGSGLGLGLGFVLAVPLLQFFASWTGYQVLSLSPSVTDIVQSFSLGLGTTIVSALWPAIQACRLSPLEAVRARGQEMEGRLLRWSWLIGLALLAFWGASFFLPWIPSTPMFIVLFGGATFLLPGIVSQIGKRLRRPVATVYGYEGSLGATNMERSRWRISTTVGVLMVGIAMSISVGAVSDSLMGSIRAWVDRALKADLFVSSATSMNPVWGSRLAAIPDVAVVSPVSTLQVQAQDPRNPDRHFATRVQAVDPTTQAQMGDQVYASGQGDPADLWATFAQGGGVLISTRIADEHHLRQGDMLRLQTARGAQDFPVTAVIVDFNNMSGVVIMTWDDVRRFYGLNSVDMYMLKVAPGADLETVRRQIETQYSRSGYLTLRSNTDVKQSLFQSVGASMVAFNAIVLIAFIIAAFSIVNTLTMNVMERTREMGLLRAVGMTRFQISKMILAEAGVMALIGGVFGAVFGGVFSRAVVWFMNTGMGFGVDYVLPVLALVISCVLMLVISQLAALLPVRRASSLAIMEALRYE